jgi:hypothetical protein
MDFSKQTVAILTHLCNNNSIVTPAKPKKADLVKLLEDTAKVKTLNLTLPQVEQKVTKSKKNKSSQLDAIFTDFIQRMTTPEIKERVSKLVDTDEKSIINEIMPNIATYSASLEPLLVEEGLTQYGVIKCIIEYNNKQKKTELLFQTKLETSSEVITSINNKLLTHILMHDDASLKTIFTQLTGKPKTVRKSRTKKTIVEVDVPSPIEDTLEYENSDME